MRYGLRLGNRRDKWPYNCLLEVRVDDDAALATAVPEQILG